MNTTDLNDIKVTAPASIDDICRILEKMPDKVYVGHAPTIQTYEEVAQKITIFLIENEAIILGAQGAENKKMLDCLVKQLQGLHEMHKMLEACLLAQVSFDDFMSATIANLPMISHGLNIDNVKNIYSVYAAMFVLGYKTEEEKKEMNIPEPMIDLMKLRQRSPHSDYGKNSSIFHDVTKPPYKYLQKMRSLISQLETQQTANTGWLPGHRCVIL